jgi:hypothetical protein
MHRFRLQAKHSPWRRWLCHWALALLYRSSNWKRRSPSGGDEQLQRTSFLGAPLLLTKGERQPKFVRRRTRLKALSIPSRSFKKSYLLVAFAAGLETWDAVASSLASQLRISSTNF